MLQVRSTVKVVLYVTVRAIISFMLDMQKEPGKRESVSLGIDIGGSNTRLGLFHSLDTPHFTT